MVANSLSTSSKAVSVRPQDIVIKDSEPMGQISFGIFCDATPLAPRPHSEDHLEFPESQWLPLSVSKWEEYDVHWLVDEQIPVWSAI